MSACRVGCGFCHIEIRPRQVSAEQLDQLFSRTRTTKLVGLGARVLETDSEDCENGRAAARALDGDGDTFWHTRSQDPAPHYLVIDLGRPVAVRALTCLQRQDRAEDRIAEVEVSCSDDPRAWGVPVATAKWRSTDQLQTLDFPRPARGRYLKVLVRPASSSNPAVAIAELDIVESLP